MKKFLITIVILVMITFILGGVFFLIDKAEYFSKGKTIFTIDEDMGEGITRKIGLGYIMYTKNTGFPTDERDNIITSWLNIISREEAIEVLGSDNIVEGLNEEEKIVKYYSYLIMTSLNSKLSEFETKDNPIIINFDNLEDLKTGEKISESTKEAILNHIKENLNDSKLIIESKSKAEVKENKNIQDVVVEGIKAGIYVDIKRVAEKNEIEVDLNQIKIEFFIAKSVKKFTLKYSFDLNALDESLDGNIFVEIK